MINVITTRVLLILISLSIIYLKKVLFFEDESDKTKRIVMRFLTAQAIWEICVFIASIFYRRLSIYAILGSTVLIYVMVTISSFRSRKRRRWFSFVIAFPLLIFSLSFYNLSRVVSATIKYLSDKSIMTNIFQVSFFGLFVILVCILRRIRGSIVWKIEKYGEGKSLSVREEIFLCVAALVLSISAGINFLFDNQLFTAIIMGYGFLMAMVILYTVYSANGRAYFEEHNHKLQRTLITTMADLVEDRDESTGGHIRRTAKYVEIVANKLYEQNKFLYVLNEKYIENMIIAAPLHDIGKIHVPDAILGKPGRLTPEEFEIMKTHTTAGYSIIEHLEKQYSEIEYIKVAKQMAKSHHEWMDGRGYPEGISGEKIPLCAKIMAVADVFDALVSKRCYKEPMPLEKAYAILREETGTHFDEDVVNAFFAARDEIEQTINEDRERSIINNGI